MSFVLLTPILKQHILPLSYVKIPQKLPLLIEPFRINTLRAIKTAFLPLQSKTSTPGRCYKEVRPPAHPGLVPAHLRTTADTSLLGIQPAVKLSPAGDS